MNSVCSCCTLLPFGIMRSSVVHTPVDSRCKASCRSILNWEPLRLCVPWFTVNVNFRTMIWHHVNDVVVCVRCYQLHRDLYAGLRTHERHYKKLIFPQRYAAQFLFPSSLFGVEGMLHAIAKLAHVTT